MSRSRRFQFFVSMSSRATYRGGRTQWRRRFSDRPYNNGGGRGEGQFVSGDSHFRSVHDSNFGYRRGNFSSHQFGQQSPPVNPNQQFRHPPPPLPQNRPLRPRPPKPLDYRSWDHAKVAPPPNSERFVVLSYNILADYLAISHRSKLYFHIPRHILDWERRKRSIVFELGLWSPDIMCLQEVDRFQDLEEELRLRGYSGVWKMRTGNAIDGCAIFWRTSRFKLLYEESTEFNKLGLRDNVAQICVFELLGQSFNENTPPPLTSSSHSNKVIVCNIHVLYNPKRGEIKLGQVRTLLDRAHAVSKMWNDAPVALCGDFNCTPKSPLYNFISEQRLDLSAVDRDKISGQYSAEICAPRPYNSNPRAQPFELSKQAPSMEGKGEVGTKPNLSDVEKGNKDGNTEYISSLDNSSVSQSIYTLLSVSDKACNNIPCWNEGSAVSDVVTKETQQTVLDGSKESSSCLQMGRFSNVQCQINEDIQNFSTPGESHPADKYDENEKVHKEKANASSHSTHGSLSEHSDSNINTENVSSNCDDSTLYLVGNDNSGRSESNSYAIEVSAYKPEFCTASPSFDSVVADKLENVSIKGLDEARVEGGSMDEDDEAFLSALHDNEDAFPSDSDQSERSNVFRSNVDPSAVELGEICNESSPPLDFEPANVETFAYDPSLWTPMEIATATGNADCTFLEHPLQLKSTYAEVEDLRGTRDSNGEPLVTSYNRCFMGTVDYIWRSKGLQTVRVLAPIQKHAMQWTPGFPTKKWGSDHIALASEVAFMK